MENENRNWLAMTDQAIIRVIGEYLRHQRLTLNKTQTQIAEDAGINPWTLSQIENSKAISLTSLIQILRALDLLNVLDKFRIEKQISPIELAKLERQKRQRARNTGKNNKTGSKW